MLLLIDNYDSFTFNLFQMLSLLSRKVVVKRNDEIDLKEIKNLNPKGIILSPGPGHPKQAGICVAIIKEFYKTIPILGVCLGHQAIAEAFSIPVIHCKKPMHGKTSIIFHNKKTIFSSMPVPFIAARYHSLMIDGNSMNPDFIVNARSEDGIIMAIQHQQYPLFGVQFHPESIMTQFGEQILQNFLNISGV